MQEEAQLSLDQLHLTTPNTQNPCCHASPTPLHLLGHGRTTLSVGYRRKRRFSRAFAPAHSHTQAHAQPKLDSMTDRPHGRARSRPLSAGGSCCRSPSLRSLVRLLASRITCDHRVSQSAQITSHKCHKYCITYHITTNITQIPILLLLQCTPPAATTPKLHSSPTCSPNQQRDEQLNPQAAQTSLLTKPDQPVAARLETGSSSWPRIMQSEVPVLAREPVLAHFVGRPYPEPHWCQHH